MITKAAKVTGAITLGLLLLGAVPSVSAEEALAVADSGAANQLAAAVQCERQADKLQASIDEQMHLKTENLKQWQLRKSPPSLDVAAADKKYDAAIAALRDTQSGWLELAHWHRLQAMQFQTADLPDSSSASN